MSSTRKPIFTVLGTIESDGVLNRVKINSPDHYRQMLSRLMPGKKVSVTIEEYVSTRTQSQLAYHWVLLTYISQHTGYTKEEMHDAIMRQKFGTKHVVVAGIEQDVRQSISNAARMPLADCVELIEEDLRICQELDIRVPTREELGYLPN